MMNTWQNPRACDCRATEKATTPHIPKDTSVKQADKHGASGAPQPPPSPTAIPASQVGSGSVNAGVAGVAGGQQGVLAHPDSPPLYRLQEAADFFFPTKLDWDNFILSLPHVWVI